MKKLAIFRTSSSELKLGSYNIQEIGLAEALFEYGIFVDIYSLFKDLESITEHKRYGDVTIRLIPLHGYKLANNLICLKVEGYIKDNNYDYVQVHEDSQIMTPIILSIAKKYGARTILYQGMYKKYKGLKGIMQKIFNFAFLNTIIKKSDMIIAKTEDAKSYLADLGICNNTFVLPVGLNFTGGYEPINELSMICDFRKSFAQILLYVGVIEERRNITFLLRVFSKMKSSYIGLVIVGRGPMLSEVKQLAFEYNIMEKILFIDEVENKKIKSVFQIANLFLLPSLYEIFSMVILESLYFGIPVLSSDTAGAKEIIKNENLGSIVELDETKWINKIDTMLQKKYDSRYLKSYVKNNYNWKIIAKKYICLLESKNENSSGK